ncbi:MAG: NADH dehydrogenase (quinone) subunit G [Legionellales bacterium]|nr:MAG: NADH dehydrogenase (quinone) subunit G [Legionellales bacterium]
MSITIEVNGKSIKTQEGATIMEAVDNSKYNINIPRFCYHKKLSIAANCRMCMVEVAKAPKPLPACATPVSDGMQVWTKSAVARDAQKAVMEFLLINHPLDCPICDQAGECELQDNSLGFGASVSGYTEAKRVVVDKSLGPLIATDMTRCIHCTRCVRFGTEVAGMREMGATGRGEHVKISTFVTKNIDSEISGNIIDLCPVGALTSKPYRYSGRSWELQNKLSIASHDCLGSNIMVHVKDNMVRRVVPHENAAINEMWLADRDRFSYQGIHSDDRLAAPLVKQDDGTWLEVAWDVALEFIQEKLQNIVTDNIGALISPNATVEEAWLLQKWLRDIGCNNIDHRLQQVDFRGQNNDPLQPGLNIDITTLENLDNIVLIGSYIRHEQPLLVTRLHKMQQQGGKVTAVDFIDIKNLAANIMQHCNSRKENLIIVGNMAQQHPEYAVIMQEVSKAAAQTQTEIAILAPGANAGGAWFAGCIPHRAPGGANSSKTGLNISEMISQQLSAYILFGIEPSLDCAQGQQLMQSLSQAKFVLACTAYKSADLLEVADILLPITSNMETSGTFVNTTGSWQSFAAAIKPHAQSKPGWQALSLLANTQYASSAAILEAIKNIDIQQINLQNINLAITENNLNNIVRLAPVAIYSSDAQVRRASALQKTTAAIVSSRLRINTQLANKLQLKDKQKVLVTNIATKGNIEIEVSLDNSVPENSVIIASGIAHNQQLGEPYARVTIAVVDCS